MAFFPSAKSPKPAAKAFAWWEPAIALAAAIGVGIGAYFLTNLPPEPAPIVVRDEQAELLSSIVEFTESAEYKNRQVAAALAKEKVALEAEQERVAREGRWVEAKERSLDLEASYQGVDEVIEPNGAKTLKADGDEANVVRVSCEKTDLGYYTVTQVSKGLELTAINLKTCKPGMHRGGAVIAELSGLDVGWSVSSEH